MKRFRTPVVAWTMFGLTVLMCLVQTWYVLSSGTPLLDRAGDGLNSFPIITVGTVLGAAIGAMVASRHPDNPVGWLFCVGVLGTATGLACEAYGTAVEIYHSPGVGGLLEPIVVVSFVLNAQWALALLAATFLVFPDGTVSSPRWRPVLIAIPVPLVTSAVVLVAYALTHDVSVHELRRHDLSRWLTWPVAVAWLLLGVLMLLSVISLVRRVRRTTGVVHQQLRWLSVSATALLVGMALALSAPDPSPSRPWAWMFFVPLYVGYAAVPIAAGIAVLRYRLYDIDVVISRAVVLALLLMFVTAGYVALVVTLGRLVGGQTGDRYWPSVLATALVALAFQPLRRRVVRLADRVAYGARAAPYEALFDLAQRLGASPDPATLLPTVAEASASAVGARSATVRLQVPGAADLVAEWPNGTAGLTGEVTAVEVRERGELLGSIAVLLPPGRRLRDPERRLLGDLADQSALAFRNSRLTAELAARVDDVDGRTAELTASRRRLFEARDAERERLETAIRRDVVPHLASMPDRLQAMAAALAASPASGAGTARDLVQLVESTGAALDELRTLTRGVFPAQLARAGLAPALATHLGRVGEATLTVHPSAAGRRFAPGVEAAVYFCAVEAVGRLTRPSEVTLEASESRLVLVVSGPQAGAAVTGALQPLRDRVESVGGTVQATALYGLRVLEVTAPLAPALVTAPPMRTPMPSEAGPARTPIS